MTIVACILTIVAWVAAIILTYEARRLKEEVARLQEAADATSRMLAIEIAVADTYAVRCDEYAAKLQRFGHIAQPVREVRFQVKDPLGEQ